MRPCRSTQCSRRGSATGALLAERTLAPGQAVRLHARRVWLRLGSDTRAGIPADRRLADLKSGKPDPALEALILAPMPDAGPMRGYYQVPAEVLEDRAEVVAWARDALGVARAAKGRKPKPRRR